MYLFRVYTHAFIQQLRERYPAGTRIELISLYDPCRVNLNYGDQGTITGIDGMANISVDWDKGCTCNLVYDDDVFQIID